MLVLALDTATDTTAVALVDVDSDGDVDLVAEGNDHAPALSCTVLAEAVHVDARGAGQVLAPLIEEVLAAAPAGMRPGRVVTGIGPGPFTSLRVGMVTAQVLAAAWGVPVAGCCSLDALAGRSGEQVVVTDARRREVYWARYADGVRVEGPGVCAPAELARALAARPAALLGPGRERYAAVWEELAGDLPPAVDAPERLSAARLVGRARRDTVEPLYLRRPDTSEPRPSKSVLAPLPEPGGRR